MMTDTSRNAGTDLIRIHNVVTRAITISIQHCRGTGPEPALRDGFQRYERALVSLLNAHHLGEDEIAFPYFEKKHLQGPFDKLRDQHRQIVVVLDKITAWVERGNSAWETASLAKLHETMVELDELWHTHIKLEEEHIGPKMVEKILTPEENVQLGDQIAAHASRHGLPAELVVPFMLYNMPANDRVVMVQGLPPVIMDQLIPYAWKATWAPMQPFLME